MDELLRLNGADSRFPAKTIKSCPTSLAAEGSGEEEKYHAIWRELEIIRQQTTALTNSLLPLRPTQESLDIQVVNLLMFSKNRKNTFENTERFHLKTCSFTIRPVPVSKTIIGLQRRMYYRTLLASFFFFFTYVLYLF
jgi:hypothetical protein